MKRGKPNARMAAGVLLAALAASSCLSSPDTSTTIHISYLESVVVPETAYAGVPFEVTINTIGASTCWSQGADHVTSVPGGYLIVPTDRYETGPETACGQAIQRFRHVVTLVHPLAATIEIQVKHAAVAPGRDDSTAVHTETVVLVEPPDRSTGISW